MKRLIGYVCPVCYKINEDITVKTTVEEIGSVVYNDGEIDIETEDKEVIDTYISFYNCGDEIRLDYLHPDGYDVSIEDITLIDEDGSMRLPRVIKEAVEDDDGLEKLVKNNVEFWKNNLKRVTDIRIRMILEAKLHSVTD